jgi:hypothetical protein
MTALYHIGVYVSCKIGDNLTTRNALGYGSSIFVGSYMQVICSACFLMHNATLPSLSNVATIRKMIAVHSKPCLLQQAFFNCLHHFAVEMHLVRITRSLRIVRLSVGSLDR